MAQAPRTLSIAYGDWIADNTTKDNFQIQGKYKLEKKRLWARVAFTVWVVGDTVEEFQELCEEIETAFETRKQRLTVKFGSVVFLDADPAQNTGKNAEPMISKPGSPEDSDTSRVYECVVEVNRPPVGGSIPSRTEESATLQYTASNRRTLTITGQYNSTQDDGAIALYRDDITAFANATKEAIGDDIVWQAKTSTKTENMTDPDGEDDRISFTLVFQELIWAESLTGTDDTTITDFAANFTIIRGFPGDAPSHPVKRVVNMTVPFSAPVDHLVTKDLVAVWNTIAKPWIITELKRTANLSTISILEENTDHNYRENIVSGTLTISGVVNGATILSKQITAALEDDFGKEITKVLDGTHYGAEEDNAIPEKIRTITVVTEKLGMWSNLGVGEYPDPVGTGPRWVKIKSSKNQSRIQYGNRDIGGENFIVTRRTEVFTQKWVTPPGEGSTSVTPDDAEITGIISTSGPAPSSEETV